MAMYSWKVLALGIVMFFIGWAIIGAAARANKETKGIYMFGAGVIVSGIIVALIGGHCEGTWFTYRCDTVVPVVPPTEDPPK